MTTSDIAKRILKNSTTPNAAMMGQSAVYGRSFVAPTPVPMLNVALSGRLDGGLTAGTTMIAGPPKHFKSHYALILCRSFLAAYPDGVVVFLDNEFGTMPWYVASLDIPTDQVVHVPFTDVEELIHEMSTQLKGLVRGDHVMFLVDSLGNAASRKEVDDALSGENKTDMTRAKRMKSFFRIVTPHLVIKDVPLVVINHTYSEQSMYPREVVGGGRGAMYAAGNVLVIGKRQNRDKKTKVVLGYDFVINIEASRFVKDRVQIPIDVTFAGGVYRWSGLHEFAEECGVIVDGPKQGTHCLVSADGEVGEPYKRDAVRDDEEFWAALLARRDFQERVVERFSLDGGDKQLVSGWGAAEVG